MPSDTYENVSPCVEVVYQRVWCWNSPAFVVNTMPTDALAPKVASASTGMVLAV